MNNIKIMESIENLDVLIDGVTKRVKNERKKKKMKADLLVICEQPMII